MRTHVLVLIALVTVACQPNPQPDATSAPAGSTTSSRSAGVTVVADKATYPRNAAVNLRLTNNTADTLGFNRCSSRTVERQSGQTWAAIPEPGRMCTMELQLLKPGETQTITVSVPANVEAGTYRISISFNRQSSAATSAVRGTSQAFQIT